MNGRTRKALVWALLLLAAAWLLFRSGIVGAAGLGLGAAGAILYLVSVDASFNAYSAINSSPWTYENMSGDSTKAKSGSKYVWLANGAATLLGLLASFIAGNVWPLVGSLTVVVLMHSLYRHAMSTGKREGNTGWQSSGGTTSERPSLTLIPASVG